MMSSVRVRNEASLLTLRVPLTLQRNWAKRFHDVGYDRHSDTKEIKVISERDKGDANKIQHQKCSRARESES